MKWLGVVARLVLAGVWLAAGLLKIGDPTENVRAVRAYDLLPEPLVEVVGHSLPVVEIVVGLCLLLGLVTRWMSVVSAAMLVAFVVGIASAWTRGMSIECGCFGGGGGPAEGASDKYPWELARDAGLLLLSAYLIWRPRTPLSLDEVVLPEVPRSAPAAATGTPSRTGTRAERTGTRAEQTGTRAERTGTRAERTRAAQQAAEIRRAAAAREQGKRNRLVTTGILVALVAVAGTGYAIQSSRDTTGQSADVPRGVVDTYALPYGADDPEVVVEVYEDFLCPFCREFESASSGVVDEYAEKGVQFRYRVLAFLDRASTDQYSTRATNALGVVLDTSGPEVAKRFHDALYDEQPAEGGPGLSDDRLVELAVEAGAKESEVAAPIRKLAFEQWVVNGRDAASKDGINQTPTVRVDGEELEPSSIDGLVEQLRVAIEERLG